MNDLTVHLESSLESLLHSFNKVIGDYRNVSARREKLAKLIVEVESTSETPTRIKINFGGKRVEVRRDILSFILSQESLHESVGYRLAMLLMNRWNRFLPRDNDGYIYFDWEATWIMPCIYAMTAQNSYDVDLLSLPDHMQDRFGFSIVSEFLHAKLKWEVRIPCSSTVIDTR
jgi:hypothetical protein